MANEEKAVEPAPLSPQLEEMLAGLPMIEVGEQVVRDMVERGISTAAERRRAQTTSYGWGPTPHKSADYYNGRLDEISDDLSRLSTVSPKGDVATSHHWRFLIEQEVTLRQAS